MTLYREMTRRRIRHWARETYDHRKRGANWQDGRLQTNEGSST